MSKDYLADILEIMEVLPHRYPFLLVDRILEADFENAKVKALKNVTMNEPFFVGHFPKYPVMPGVLIIEAMAQVGAFMLMKHGNLSPETHTVFFASIDNAKFRRQVVPGDQIIFEVEAISIKRSMGKMKAVAKVGDEIAAEATLMAVTKKL